MTSAEPSSATYWIEASILRQWRNWPGTAMSKRRRAMTDARKKPSGKRQASCIIPIRSARRSRLCGAKHGNIMTTLCTFSQVAQLRAALPTDEENVTLQYTPIRGEHFARLDCGRVSVLAEPIRGLLASPRATQPKRWTLPRTELD